MGAGLIEKKLEGIGDLVAVSHSAINREVSCISHSGGSLNVPQRVNRSKIKERKTVSTSDLIIKAQLNQV